MKAATTKILILTTDHITTVSRVTFTDEATQLDGAFSTCYQLFFFPQ